ncbi:MAG TPA: AraC family transcriptional regulator [Gammaproteobacteria bacterium]|nr:AraC family transcriptional regulator [Gammaproteobacteria bacterium]
MLGFYKKAILMFAGLVALTLVSTLVCWKLLLVRDVLLPAGDSVIPWKFETMTDVRRGGASSITVNDSSASLDYDYILTEDVQYPQVTAIFNFAGQESARQYADLSKYSTVAFRAKCRPRNVLTFHLYSFDPKVTDPADFNSYRIAKAFFPCDEEWSDVEIDLKHLYVPTWWLSRFKIEVSDQNYRLNQVAAFSIIASFEGPVGKPANVRIGELGLRGRDWRYAWACGVLLVLVWAGFILWLFRRYTQSLVADMQDKLRKDRPLLAYQQLSVQPQEDREKTLLLRFMATEYADPDLSLEKTISTLGISRTKINEILKSELGYTFTGCLNKLRLTEAARLLSENDNANVAEIAYSVGYNNLTYFIRLFKNEYGSTPKAFKGISRSGRADNGGG